MTTYPPHAHYVPPDDNNPDHDHKDEQSDHAHVNEWAIDDTHPEEFDGDGCFASVDHRYINPATTAAVHEYRGHCPCGWRGPTRDDEQTATEDAHDHAWPEWRTIPPCPNQPAAAAMGDRKKQEKWYAACRVVAAAEYPESWLVPGTKDVRPGAPIVTIRDVGTRHVPDRSPWGGYDMSRTTAAEDLRLRDNEQKLIREILAETEKEQTP